MGASMEGLTGTLERLIPHVKEHDALSMASIRVTMDRALSGNNQAKAAIDNALFDLAATPVSTLAVGDSVRFEAIDEQTYRSLGGQL